VRGVASPELKAECIRLRVEENLPLPEIHRRTGAPNGSISNWLLPFPLSKEALKERRKVYPIQRVKKDRGEDSTLYQLRHGSLDRAQVGQIAEAAILLRLVVGGFKPYGSPFDGDRTDWLIEVPETGRFLKLQVKACKNDGKGLPRVSLLCMKNGKQRRYEKEDIDCLVGYDLRTDTAYVWLWEELQHLKAVITVCPETAETWDKLRK